MRIKTKKTEVKDQPGRFYHSFELCPRGGGICYKTFPGNVQIGRCDYFLIVNVPDCEGMVDWCNHPLANAVEKS